ncbi:MAG: PIN domain-containing protein, partial [Prevotella sp.]|nr:PIN domain-containing protein [Candidatus Prevotella equi]
MVEHSRKYLLDTNVIIQILRGDKDIIKHVYQVGIDNCHISEITIAELYYGAVKGKRQSNFDDIDIISETFDIIPVFNSFEKLARIRLYLSSIGKLVDAYDMMIGATAVNENLTLVTHNTKHYKNIPDIMLEDWQN